MKHHLGIALFSVLFSFFTCAHACTDFRITAKDGTIIVTRSLEFALDLKSNLRTSTRGRAFAPTILKGQPGLTWKAKYGYVYLDGLNVDIAMDGMNEKGLSFEALYLPGLAQYQTLPQGQEKNALPYLSIGDWILSNFATVDEVRQALSHIYIVDQQLPQLNNFVFPLHFAVYDNTGKSIVIEYIEGKLNIYDNAIGIMTNSPEYSWQLTNLNNYVNLAPENPKAVLDSGIKFAATGQGFGMVGLPGDISPPSRFVKTATLARVALTPADASMAVNLAEHIINNVDIPLGLAREPQNGNYTNDTTQWVVFKDLTHLVFYYRTYENLRLRAVTLSKLNFAENAPRLKMPLTDGEAIQDKTSTFLQSTIKE